MEKKLIQVISVPTKNTWAYYKRVEDYYDKIPVFSLIYFIYESGYIEIDFVDGRDIVNGKIEKAKRGDNFHCLVRDGKKINVNNQ